VTTGFTSEEASPELSGNRTASAGKAYGKMTSLELSCGRSAMSIWLDLVDTHGFTGGYQSVKRFVRKLRGTASPEAREIIETRPGEESQIDYGTGPMVRAAVYSDAGMQSQIGSSAGFKSSTQGWSELQEKAFLRLVGSPLVAVLDNPSLRGSSVSRHLRSALESLVSRRSGGLHLQAWSYSG